MTPCNNSIALIKVNSGWAEAAQRADAKTADRILGGREWEGWRKGQRAEQGNSHSGKVVSREQGLELVPGPSQELGQGRQLLLLGNLADQVDELAGKHMTSKHGSMPVRQCDHQQPTALRRHSDGL